MIVDFSRIHFINLDILISILKDKKRVLTDRPKGFSVNTNFIKLLFFISSFSLLFFTKIFVANKPQKIQ